MNPRVAIALLVVIVVLFVVGVGCGALPKDSNVNPGWADAIGRLLVKQATVDDLVLKSGACSRSGDSITILKTGSCTVQVVDRRRLNLTVTQGLITINVTQSGVSGKQDPKNDQTYEFILDKPDTDKPFSKQDQFTAGCGPTTNCALRVNG